MAKRTSDIHTEVQDRFEVAAWFEGELKGVWTQVLDLRPYSAETRCRFVKVVFGGCGQFAHTRTDHSRHTLRKLNAPDAWQCDCPAGLAGRTCYHVRAANAALHLLEKERRQLLATAPRMPEAAPAAAATW